ncbi:TolC family protein [Rhodocytophaga aerolata]|uniref:TolC family protein n=1 Tax=Rhodocytophaga aerolata TaxID=455078 RepID=A0ABT8RD21_9BACT|nr:TolC family protein [Rhodocytophaga aerolata]MDO1449229.1 TolC family protein [Rhodocytophaga aerolata]
MKTTHIYTQIIMLAAMVSFLPHIVAAQEHVSLAELLERVETTYPDITKYEANLKAAQARVEGARSWMPPTFSAGLNRIPYNVSIMQNEMDPMNQAGLMFSLEQMIPNPAKLNAKENYYRSLGQIQQKNADWAKNSYRAQAKVFYYNRYINEKRLAIIGESEELLGLFISTAENRYAYNQSELSNIYTLKARLEEVKNMRLMAEAGIAESTIGINTLLNRDPDLTFSIDTVMKAKEYVNISAVTAAQNRADIEAMESSIASMQLNREVMAAGRKPDFGVRVEHMQMFGMPNQFSLMGMVTIPIVPWSSGMYKSEVKSMNFEIEAMQKEKEGMQLMAGRMISEKLTMLKYEKAQLKNYQENIIPAFRKSLDVNFIAYRQNTGSFASLMDAWDMLLMKQLEKLDKEGNVLKLEAEYEYETGNQ